MKKKQNTKVKEHRVWVRPKSSFWSPISGIPAKDFWLLWL